MSGAKKWVLIADDEPEVRELIDNYIEMNYGESLMVVHASDGVEASHKIKFQAFDIIITDLKMPKREGQAFIQTALDSQLNNNTPIIVITGYPDPSLERKYSHLKMIPKPFEMSTLLDEINNQLRLGKIDQRIGAAVLNAYIQGTVGFISKVMNLEPEQELTELKKPGYFNTGREHVRITFKSGKARCVFVIGFDHSVVDRISKSLNTDVALDSQLICVTAAKTIFRRASTYLWKESNARPILIECSHIAKENEEAQKSLASSRGISIPLKTEAGYIIAQAIWEEKYIHSLDELNKRPA